LIAIAAFAAWAFSDEMGIRSRSIAPALSVRIAIHQVQIALGGSNICWRYLCFTRGRLCTFWSIALLHRQRELKVVGAVGLLATALPIAAIVIGHVAVGVGVTFGVSGLLSAAQGASPDDTSFVTMVERIFGLWGYVAAWLLWRGHIVNAADHEVPQS
jgi:hypothetical protein